jgi:hypothetical protein
LGRKNAYDGYINLDANESCVDGWYSAADLRKIADKMDELKAYNYNSTFDRDI